MPKEIKRCAPTAASGSLKYLPAGRTATANLRADLASRIDYMASIVPRSHQAWCGRPGQHPEQASLSRLLAMCATEPMSEDQARRVGVLAGKAAHDDIVDVTVVEGAARRRDSIVTSSDTHIRASPRLAGARLHIEHI